MQPGAKAHPKIHCNFKSEEPGVPILFSLCSKLRTFSYKHYLCSSYSYMYKHKYIKRPGNEARS